MILTTIGRNKGNRYVIDDPQKRISDYHAEIKVCDDNSITLIDHSLNGTSVNGKKIEKEVEVQINRGTEIIFGGFAKLDWARIPMLPPIPPGTKLYSIGTHLTNRILINDGSNMVSRYHATLKIAPNGKMTINDHSANGTFVNGSRISPNQDVRVKRRDKILFANTQPLDWTRIPNSKPNPWLIISPIAAVLVVGLILLFNYWNPFPNPTPSVDQPANQILASNSKTSAIVFSGSSAKGTTYTWTNDNPSIGLASNGTGDIAPFNATNTNHSATTAKIVVTPVVKGNLGPSKTFTITVNSIQSKNLGPVQNNQITPAHGDGINSGPIMTESEIYAKYDKAVVCIRHQYRIIAELPNKEKFVFLIDKEKGEYYLLPVDDPNSGQLIQGCTGTAFFVDNKGIMMTNRHVVMPWESDIDFYKRFAASKEKLKANIYDIYGESLSIGFVLNGHTINSYNDFISCVILSQKSNSIEKDVALLQTKDKRLPDSNICPITINNAMVEPSNLAPGQKVYVMGFPKGLSPSILIGSGADNAVDIRSTNQGGSINTTPGHFVFGVNVQMTHGASGSPVLNDRGQLIGVYNSGLDVTGGGLNAAVLAKHAKELYQQVN